jgi:hypothetical protein
MDAARLSAVINRGHGIAARNIALQHEHYRPAGAHNPLAAGNQLGTIHAAFDPPSSGGFSFTKASTHQDQLFHGLFDATGFQVFDYLREPASGRTFFVAGLDHIEPPLCVECQRIVTVSRPQGATQVGVNPYGGSVPETEIELMVGWPAALVEGRGGAKPSASDLPGDAGFARYALMLPYVEGVVLRPSDIIVDELGRRYIATGFELQSYGWRGNMMQVAT